MQATKTKPRTHDNAGEIRGEVVDNTKTIDFDTVCDVVSNKIVELQNESYASKPAQKLQAWLGNFVVFWSRR